MGDVLTTGETSLVQYGKSEAVFEHPQGIPGKHGGGGDQVVEELSGRRVMAFMSNNHIDPDLAVEIFVLQRAPDARPSDEASDGHARLR